MLHLLRKNLHSLQPYCCSIEERSKFLEVVEMTEKVVAAYFDVATYFVGCHKDWQWEDNWGTLEVDFVLHVRVVLSFTYRLHYFDCAFNLSSNQFQN